MIFGNVKTLRIPEGSVVKITRDGETLWQKVTGRIPSEYQEVEWLQSSGISGPWIDLGFAFDTKGKTEMSQYMVNATAAYTFGATENSGKVRYLLTSPYSTNSRICFYSSLSNAFVELALDMVVGEYNEITMFSGGGIFYVENKANNGRNQHTCAEKTMTNNLYLFGQNYNGSVRTGSGTRRIKYFRYYDKNDELICDLVPCYRKSDGVMGMYDMARSIFLTKAGGGEWTKGADVTA